MDRMLAVLRRKSLWLAVAGVVLAAAVFVALTPTNEAVVFPPGPGVTVYYSNASYTTVVGARGSGCCGEVINWGITTKYKKFEKLYCLDVPCPN
jgi:hypothetical protein